MIKYIKENLDSIFKLFINHVGMMIFGLVVLLTSKLLSSKINNEAVYIVMGVLTALMYYFLLYIAMWERGAKDKIKLDGGRMRENKFHGLAFYFIANVIGVISGAVVLLFSFFTTEDESIVNSIYAIFKFIAHYWNSMYLPLTTIQGVPSVIYLLVLLPGALVSFVSYILGIKGFKCLFPESKYDRNRKLR